MNRLSVISIRVMVLAVFGASSAEALVCWNGGKHVWSTALGPNVRTGKSADSPSVAVAQKNAYNTFLVKLTDAGKDCLGKAGGYLEFGPIRSFSDGPSPSSTYSAAMVVEVGCCVS